MSLETFENLRLELRRGCLVLAVLAKLRSEYHGYALVRELREGGLEIDENTLYPLLRRLETQKLLVSQWRVEDKRNKRFYRLTEGGESVLAWLLEEWRNINGAIEKLSEAPLAAERRDHETGVDESGIAGPVHSRSEDDAATGPSGRYRGGSQVQS